MADGTGFGPDYWCDYCGAEIDPEEPHMLESKAGKTVRCCDACWEPEVVDFDVWDPKLRAQPEKR